MRLPIRRNGNFCIELLRSILSVFLLFPLENEVCFGNRPFFSNLVLHADPPCPLMECPEMVISTPTPFSAETKGVTDSAESQ